MWKWTAIDQSPELADHNDLTLSLFLPELDEPITLEGNVVWHEKSSLEDNAPYDVGVEIVSVEDRNKNVFLKYLCDLLYESTYKART